MVNWYLSLKGLAVGAHNGMGSFQVSTHDYDTDVVLVKKAMSQMESLLGEYGGYVLGEPSSRMGWTFFTLSLGLTMQDKMESKFSDMIQRYTWEKPEVKLAMFINDYLKSRGCNTKVKLD